MGLTARPSKNIDLAKIDEIQSEFFDDETIEKSKSENNKKATEDKKNKISGAKVNKSKDAEKTVQDSKKKISGTKTTKQVKKIQKDLPGGNRVEQEENMKIADLLATAKFEGVRHTSRPYTVPRSLTIDLTRLKSKFRSRNLQYTQNELMDKMVKESLEIVTADNFHDLREKAFGFVKSPENCSRRSVTLTEETVSGMNELKADLALKHNRRFSADEVFTTLLAVAFSPLYENDML